MTELCFYPANLLEPSIQYNEFQSQMFIPFFLGGGGRSRPKNHVNKKGRILQIAML